MAEPAAGGAGTLLYVVTEDWFFASHFLPMARTAVALGHNVAVATRVNRHRAPIEAAGVRVIPVDFDRGSNGLFTLRRQIAAMADLIRREQPRIVHCIALRSVIVGGFAAVRAKVPGRVHAITGLGHLWVSETPSARLGRRLVRWWIGRLRRPGAVFLFENHEDPAALGLAADAADVTFVPGAGVDPAAFPALPPPAGPLKAAMVGRMLWAKGADSAVEAIGQLSAKGVAVELDLWGEPDPDNPASIQEAQLRRWSERPGIHWRGRSDDIGAVWRETQIALAPSRYREGVPRAIVEAMASARPVVTTDVPGCREIVRDGVDGFVVAKDDVAALAEAIATLAADPALRQRMGASARQRFEEGYTEAVVTARITELYRALGAR